MKSAGVFVAVLIAASLLLFAALKLISGHDPTRGVGLWSHWGAICVELTLAFMLLFRQSRRIALVTVSVMCLGVAAIGSAEDWSTPCGCLGDVDLSMRGRVLIASGLGLGCCIGLWLLSRISGVRDGGRQMSDSTGAD